MYDGHSCQIPAQRSSKAEAGTEMSSTSSVIAIANTPSLNASVRAVSQRVFTAADSRRSSPLLSGGRGKNHAPRVEAATSMSERPPDLGGRAYLRLVALGAVIGLPAALLAAL